MREGVSCDFSFLNVHAVESLEVFTTKSLHCQYLLCIILFTCVSKAVNIRILLTFAPISHPLTHADCLIHHLCKEADMTF